MARSDSSSQGIGTNYSYDSANRIVTISHYGLQPHFSGYQSTPIATYVYSYLCSGQPGSHFFFKEQPCWVAPRGKHGRRTAA